jgi:hypothetical protein
MGCDVFWGEIWTTQRAITKAFCEYVNVFMNIFFDDFFL